MKRIIILFLSLLAIINVFGQYSTSNPDDKNYGYYYSKYRTQNTTGVILLLGGSTMVVVGAVGVLNNFELFDDNLDNNKTITYFSIFLVGVVTDIVSIPFFISASANKKKAARLGISNQIIYQPQNNLMALQKQSIPSVTLKIEF